MIATSDTFGAQSTPIISQRSALTFLEFLEKRQVKVFLFTDHGDTKITMPHLSPAEAQRLLAEWQSSQS